MAITPRRHYAAFLLGIMSVVADWANSTIVNGVVATYSSYTIPNTNFATNISSTINSFSYRGLVNFAGGSQLQCIFLTAIMIYMIDRKFLHALVWSLLGGIFALFGLIHASDVGILIKKTDHGWRFTVAYSLLALVFLLMEFAQRKKWIEPPETEPDDLSSPEWAEWKRLQQTDIVSTTNIQSFTLENDNGIIEKLEVLDKRV